MSLNGEEEAIDIARRAEHKANGAYDHALNLHEGLGKIFRSVQTVVLQLNDVKSQVQDIKLRLGSFRKELESVPELVQEEITNHGVKDDAETYRSIKTFFKSAAGQVVSKGAIGLVGLGLGYLAHRLGIIK